ncbi:TRAP transporter substrate-binding protein DctP [Marinomonas foliarum]|uniref:TRAP-type C4-dicarboxylate transport system substrate-binding protein n=1 Tax=Marinomonas foliarum TaxID=491950 RepID=A0A368ZUY3_9GAMM|nr:TRAP transporter substrate-binding protein DctP [Marinomonas foliarum]RCW99646.1 TRAP-type C4-dicarboxylate transport system substrate-binding protein [Marinomonas foliarum]
MKSLNIGKIVKMSALATAVATLSGCSEEDKSNYVLQYSTYTTSTSDQSKTVQRWAKEVERLTEGGVKVEFHYSQSLAKADDSLSATVDGRADIAQIGSIYATSGLPMFTVVELPFETNNPETQMKAIERLYQENSEFKRDFDENGVKLLFPLPLGSVLIGLKEPASTPSQLSGRSIRSGGLTSEVLMAENVNPVSMTATDIYESMSRGIVDGYSALALANLPTFGLAPITPYLVNPGIGAYSSSIVVINKGVFDSMPEKYQNAVMQASKNSISYGLEEMDAAGQVACSQLKESDVKITEFSNESVADWKAKVSADKDWVDRYNSRGYKSQLVINSYRNIIKEEEDKSKYISPIDSCLGG